MDAFTRPYIPDAPGLVWATRKVGLVAEWHGRTDILKRGFRPQRARMWAGIEPTPEDRERIAAGCRSLQAEMLDFNKNPNRERPVPQSENRFKRRDNPKPKVHKPPREVVDWMKWGAGIDPKTWIKVHLTRMARVHAISAGRPFKLTPADLIAMAERQNYRCAVSGVQFRPPYFASRRRKNPLMPSIDRIDSNLGYEAENLRLVCFMVNLGLNEFGDAVFIHMCHELVKHCAKAR